MSNHAELPPLPAPFVFAREFQLILACSWIAPDFYKANQGSKLIELCSDAIDWGAFFSLLERHKLSGIAYTVLTQHAGPLVPSDIKAELKIRKLRDWKKAILYAAELVRLSKAFSIQQIEQLPLKGITLSIRVFGDPGMRHVRDLDMLILPDRIDQADEVLRAEGYRRVYPELQSTPQRKKLQLQHQRHLEYYRDDMQVRIELHWKWDMLSAQKVSKLWSHTHSLPWQGTEIKMLNDDLLLLTLCDHGAGHRFMRLKWLGDSVMMLVNTPPSSWHRILDLASFFDMERPLAEVALLAHWLYGIEIPHPLAALVQREKPAFPMACESIRQMLAEAKNTKDPQGRLTLFQYAKAAPAQYLEALRYTRSLRKRSSLRISLTRDLIRSADFEALPLPDRFSWLYYPLRPFLWIWRHATRSTR